MGAWIETVRSVTPVADRADVAPYMGAWIETYKLLQCPIDLNSRALYGCVD